MNDWIRGIIAPIVVAIVVGVATTAVALALTSKEHHTPAGA